MTTAEVANQLVALCRAGKFLEAIDTLYADNVTSVEAQPWPDSGRETLGKAAVRGKSVWWFENNEVHTISVTGPFVSPERFAVVFNFDYTRKADGQRVQFSEAAVYTVENGQIVRDEFLYAL
jgi:ketosteroid isomerase-like protein